MKHTPGPWQYISIGTQHFIAQQCDETGRFAICKVAEQPYHPTGGWREEAISNARLIAAAPEMLAALQELLLAVNLDKVPGIGQATDMARAAIRKATGD